MINNTEYDALKAARRIAREEEIRVYGHPICWSKIVQSDKIYTRKQKHKKQYV